LVHRRTEAEAEAMKAALATRLAECQLEMHPEKTKIVYCKDGRRKGKYPNTKFDFLGYCLRTSAAINRNRKLFTGYGPQVSAESLKAAENPGVELTQTHTRAVGGYRQGDQPNPARLVELLWPILPSNPALGVEVCQRHIDRVGDAQVQALCGTKNTGWPNDWFHCHQAAQTVRT
jgi:hypothetical protein